LMGIRRWGKCRKLAALEQAGILRIVENGRHTVKVQLCFWPDPPDLSWLERQSGNCLRSRSCVAGSSSENKRGQHEL
jgi:hypothetical protein